VSVLIYISQSRKGHGGQGKEDTGVGAGDRGLKLGLEIEARCAGSRKIHAMVNNLSTPKFKELPGDEVVENKR